MVNKLWNFQCNLIFRVLNSICSCRIYIQLGNGKIGSLRFIFSSILEYKFNWVYGVYVRTYVREIEWLDIIIISDRERKVKNIDKVLFLIAFKNVLYEFGFKSVQNRLVCRSGQTISLGNTFFLWNINFRFFIWIKDGCD